MAQETEFVVKTTSSSLFDKMKCEWSASHEFAESRHVTVRIKSGRFNAYKLAAAAAKSLQTCPTLCDLIDGSPPGSPVPGILQARTLEWVATSFSSAWKWKVKVKSLSRVRLLATPWTAAYQAPLSMGFSRQEYWSGVPLCTSLVCINFWLCISWWSFERLSSSMIANEQFLIALFLA